VLDPQAPFSNNGAADYPRSSSLSITARSAMSSAASAPRRLLSHPYVDERKHKILCLARKDAEYAPLSTLEPWPDGQVLSCAFAGQFSSSGS
jgi:hypothetical protein